MKTLYPPLTSYAPLDPFASARALPARKTPALAMVSAARALAARENLFIEGDPVKEAFRVEQGAIMVLRQLSGGRRQILDIAGPGRMIGYAADGRHDCAAVALVPSLVVAIWENAESRGAAMLAEIHRLRDLAALLGRKTALERLASFLVEMAGPDPDARRSLDLPVSRQEIADYLGLVGETVCRNFAVLKKRGILKPVGRDELAIADIEALRRIAAGEEAASA